MIPEVTNSLHCEIASTGSEPLSMVASEPTNDLGTTVKFKSLSVASLSTYLLRIPSGSRQWEIYLNDLVEAKNKRFHRVQKETENVTDFLLRFPIYEVS